MKNKQLFNKDLKDFAVKKLDTQSKQTRKPSNKVMMDCKNNGIKQPSQWW